MDASYGTNSPLRLAITELGLCYVAAIISTVKVRPVSKDDPNSRRVSVATLARRLPKHAWRTITWREGSNAKLRSRFARVRVCAAPMHGQTRFGEETLLIEWLKSRTDEILAHERRPRHVVCRPGRSGQVALAHRARLSGTQAGNRHRPLRGPHLAGLPPSRHAVDRGLRFLDLRTGENPPLSTTSRPCNRETCASQWLPTPRRPRSGRSATSPTRSPRSGASWPLRLPPHCYDASVACGPCHRISDEICDPVVLDAFLKIEAPEKPLKFLSLRIETKKPLTLSPRSPRVVPGRLPTRERRLQIR
jgi:hypothetical protein